MLAPMQGEIQILEVPLKKNRTLVASNKRLVVHDQDSIIFAVLIESVRSVTSIKKDTIRIQHYAQNSNGEIKREYIDFKLHNSKYSANQTCHKIISKYEQLNIFTSNTHGMMILQPHEHIIDIYHDTKTNQGKGLLYITNVGIALETADEGVICDVPFEKFSLVTAIKKNKIRIVWYEKNKKFKFDFEIDNTKRDAAMSMMQNALDQHRTNTGYAFLQFEQKYHTMTPDDFFALAQARNPEFIDYLSAHAIHTFGFFADKFAGGDQESILACKVLGYPVEMISHVSDEELQQRKTTYDSALRYQNFCTEYRSQKLSLDNLEKQCNDADDLKKLRKTSQYKDIEESLDKLLKDTAEFGNGGAVKMERQASAWALQATDKRYNIVYAEWCKSHPLPDITNDEYNKSWESYLLEKLNNSKGRQPIVTSQPHFESLQDAIKVRDRNTSTLDMFVKPERVADEDIYNNCWHDKQAKMWYVQNDNLSEKLTELAVSDPEHSQHTCGRRVWGFSEDMVEMHHGFPSVMAEFEDCDRYMRIKMSRKTGVDIRYFTKSKVPFLLPILTDDDITEELERNIGKYAFGTREIRFVVQSSGCEYNMTPKEYKLYCKVWGFQHLPIAERVRRALFTVESGLTLDEEETEQGLSEHLNELPLNEYGSVDVRLPPVIHN